MYVCSFEIHIFVYAQLVLPMEYIYTRARFRVPIYIPNVLLVIYVLHILSYVSLEAFFISKSVHVCSC